jgi:hypothetical protein
MLEASSDQFNMAMRLAIAGNVIDFGPQEQLDIMETINRVVHSKLIYQSLFLLSQNYLTYFYPVPLYLTDTGRTAESRHSDWVLIRWEDDPSPSPFYFPAAKNINIS